MRALFFDLDGTLADSLSLLYRSYSEFVVTHGGSPSKEEFQELNGPPLKIGMQLLKKRYGITGDPEHLSQTFIAKASEQYHEIPMMEGAESFLRWAHAEGYTIGLVTSGPRSTSSRFLVRHQVDHLFSFLVTADDVQYGKPNPEPYLLALKKSGVAPNAALAIEDAAKGVAAARAAGINCIRLGSEEVDDNGASHCVRSWSQLNPSIIDALFL